MTVRKKRSTPARHYPRWDVRLLRGAMNGKDLLFRAAHAATIKLLHRLGPEFLCAACSRAWISGRIRIDGA